MTNHGPASTSHCFFCFEVLSAHFEGREPPDLAKVVQLYEEYQSSRDLAAGPAKASLAVVENIRDASSTSSSTGTPSGSSEDITPARSASRSPASLTSGLTASYPVYVTWNTLSRRGKSLRGCIGTFESLPLEHGLRTYTLVSALEDYRFNPIPASLVSSLGCELTLLSTFEDCRDAMDWEIGTHGLKISFVWRGRRMGATYLPHVCPEQGWDKEECVESLMCKAGWDRSANGRGGVKKWLSGASTSEDEDGQSKKPWETVGDMKVVRYQGAHAAASYGEWREWRAWARGRI